MLPQRLTGDFTVLKVGIWGKRVVIDIPFGEPHGKRSGPAHVFEIVDGNGCTRYSSQLPTHIGCNVQAAGGR